MKTVFSPTLTQQLIDKINQQSLPSHYIKHIEQWLLPLAKRINQLKLKSTHPIIISINGAQGSGKSTMTEFISLLLNEHFKQTSLNLSIDDFYLTKAQRLERSKTIHPLLMTRGVPGTHDIELALDTLKQLQQCNQSHPCYIPQFNKATDDRLDKSQWVKQEEPVDILLFEGWCNHAPIQLDCELEHPINTLERLEDKEAVWRKYVNTQLKTYHETLFSRCDSLIFLEIPHFKKVYEWRALQENKLKQNTTSHTGMNNPQLERFIQHFERITKVCLAQLPSQAEIVIKINENHQIDCIDC